jgi:hypothetical protein
MFRFLPRTSRAETSPKVQLALSPGGHLVSNCEKIVFKLDPFRVVTGENGALFKFWLLKMYPFLRNFCLKFKKSTLFKTTFEKSTTVLAIFEQPAPCQKHPLLLDVVVAHASRPSDPLALSAYAGYERIPVSADTVSEQDDTYNQNVEASNLDISINITYIISLMCVRIIKLLINVYTSYYLIM